MDNFNTHSSNKTRAALEELDGKIELHFLPKYSPESNDIEQVWGGSMKRSLDAIVAPVSNNCASAWIAFLSTSEITGSKRPLTFERLDAESRETVYSNHETCLKITEARFLEEMSTQCARMLEDPESLYLRLEYLGAKLYAEPPN
jgi:hypothetical protein